MPNTTELDTKIVPVVSFRFCVFYPNGKVKKIRGVREESWVIWETELEKGRRLGARSWPGLCLRPCPIFLSLQGLGWGVGRWLPWMAPAWIWSLPPRSPRPNQPGNRLPRHLGIWGETYSGNQEKGRGGCAHSEGKVRGISQLWVTAEETCHST